jgi:hypothetical protein
MGRYINTTPAGDPLPAKGKAQVILTQFPGAVAIERPSTLVPGLVCVIDNYVWDAAGWVYDELELRDFQDIDDLRPKRWLIVPGVEKYAHR